MQHRGFPRAIGVEMQNALGYSTCLLITSLSLCNFRQAAINSSA